MKRVFVIFLIALSILSFSGCNIFDPEPVPTPTPTPTPTPITDWDYRYNVEFDFFQQKIKNETLVTVALNDPNAEITSMNSITISHKKKFYERPIVWAVAGIATGIIISK